MLNLELAFFLEVWRKYNASCNLGVCESSNVIRWLWSKKSLKINDISI